MELIQQIAWSIFGIGVFLLLARVAIAGMARLEKRKETKSPKADNPILGYNSDINYAPSTPIPPYYMNGNGEITERFPRVVAPPNWREGDTERNEQQYQEWLRDYRARQAIPPVNVMDTIRLAQAPNWTEYNELMSKIKRRDEKKKESLDDNSIEAIKLDPLSRFDDLD